MTEYTGYVSNRSRSRTLRVARSSGADDNPVATTITEAHKHAGIIYRVTGDDVAYWREAGTVYVYGTRRLVMGTVTVTPMVDGRTLVDGLAVRPYRQGQDIARAMLSEVAGQLRGQGVGSVVAVTRPGMDAATHLLRTFGSLQSPHPLFPERTWHIVRL